MKYFIFLICLATHPNDSPGSRSPGHRSCPRQEGNTGDRKQTSHDFFWRSFFFKRLKILLSLLTDLLFFQVVADCKVSVSSFLLRLEPTAESKRCITNPPFASAIIHWALCLCAAARKGTSISWDVFVKIHSRGVTEAHVLSACHVFQEVHNLTAEEQWMAVWPKFNIQAGETGCSELT